MRIGAIEAGGTKMVCGIGDENGNLLDRISIPTTDPETTFGQMIDYFKNIGDKLGDGIGIETLGIGSFGPVDLNKASSTYGYITSTPKPGWANTDFVGTFKKALGVPVGFDTDVNGAILGEVTYGAAKGASSAIYITIGTGVGVGVYYGGQLMHGLVHPEAGHILLMKHPRDTYEGKCPYHKTCMEGLAAGPAIQARWGKPAIELVDNPEVWEIEAYYIAQAITTYVLCYSPEKIILWGGVMHQEKLFEMIRNKVKELLGGYISSPALEGDLSDYIIAPGLGDDPGIKGAIKLGIDAKLI